MTLLDETLGATLLGAVVSTLLFGLALAQLYTFATSQYKTSRAINLLVVLVG
jgi:hypothetical protein